ncbi:hypothetical protein TBLA_0A01950 [Henningerozyma blattae CBS 6284]|uniref:Oxidation resistance protein 1 n=1 Tax=Henningerozyma blattae (strain ATCC 34711 / CBS 6284 / DSM 70876 / NBRC 10599 / NRRL Y-10934 / UCD 77-7) TaxID=1071380 RepID=I2GV44_HENB6|nr:hypothetical protein TBLA_0A01950 [Tetrapisispora blattae CBS 6284]CCH57996.1 hypothetical protein TBLA_0A01950 [Tetrapisispora blattae CBS 6284]
MYKFGQALNKLRRSATQEEQEQERERSSSPSYSTKMSKTRPPFKSSSSTSINGEISNTQSPFGYNDDDDDSLPPVILTGYSPNTKNRLLTTEMCDELRTLMPTRVQLYPKWRLLYSLEQHGASLHSLYHNIAPEDKTPMRVGYVLIIKDRLNGIFGAYCNEPFHPTEKHKYFGNGECFLWKMEKVPDLNIGETKDEKEYYNSNIQNDQEANYQWRFKGFPSTGLNEFFIYCTSKFLSMGAGEGHYGLWCDDGLIHGVSNPSLTFGNDILSREGNKFHIVGLEMWRVG